ncbi:hypothetical protein VTN00DRAFT_6907 [Thermoascus crustaceus]|uniref:uncharacterized protein n=1 Tax=Thermoascus crustaceus TaxID=5088 RepID=UPI00374462D1
MESWRERGFVPDSDEDDEFESQGSRRQGQGQGQNLQQRARDIDTDVDEGDVNGAIDDNNNGGKDVQGKGKSGDDQDSKGGEREREWELSVDDENESWKSPGPESMEIDSVDGREKQSAGEGEGKEKEDGNADQQMLDAASTVGEDQTNPPSSPELADAQSPSPSQELASTQVVKRPSVDPFDFPSSSPDELQFEYERPKRPVPSLAKPQKDKPQKDTQPDLPDENESVSSLSSPPSTLESLHTPRPANDDRQREAEKSDSRLGEMLPPPEIPKHSPSAENGNYQQGGDKPDNQPEDLLPPLDVPEDVLREIEETEQIEQRTRRSLRQRNPIQKHPYLLEDAQYQRLMRAGGIKPVRMPNLDPRPRREADESQEQDVLDIPEPPSSSPVTEFQFPPSSPPDPYEIVRERSQRRTPGSAPRPRQTTSASKDSHLPKRRKLFHARERQDGEHPRRARSSNLQVVVNDGSSSPREVQTGGSIFDIPPSPPSSGSLSSQTTQAPSGFRFPRGFTPALNTPVTDPITESRSKQSNVDEVSIVDVESTGPGRAEEPDQSQASSSGSEPESNAEEDEEEIVKQLQRKIRGVLPASWLKLDLKQQEEQQRAKATQRHRDLNRQNQLEGAKGVARKINRRRSRSATPSNRRVHEIFALEDPESDSDGDNASTNIDSRKTLAGLVGFDDPFGDVGDGDDIPEDNRIDYMLPSTSRKSSGTERKHTKRDKTDLHGGSKGEIWPTKKRSHLKRQTRITDSMTRERKPRRSSPKLPKRGILDAPDVAQRPRHDQPLFLRVAARQARSRQDRGRASPSRKFIRLGTRLDTEEANMSLRDWKRGAIPKAKIAKPQAMPRKRQPLANLSTNSKQDVSSRPASRRLPDDDAGDPGPRWVDEMDIASEKGPSPDMQTAPLTEVRRPKIIYKNPLIPERRGNQWVISRNFAVSSLKRNDPRPAELEAAETGSGSRSASSFQRSLAALNRSYRHARAHLPRKFRPNLTLDRYLSQDVPSAAPVQNAQTISANVSEHPPQRPAAQEHRRVRKRPPRRIDASTAEHQQPPTLTFEDSGAVSSVSAEEFPTAASVLKGLDAFKTSYTVDFNVAPLQLGTYFHESTFIGGSEFTRSLDIRARDLDKEAGQFLVELGDQTFRWSAWSDTVSSELGLVFDVIAENMERAGGGEQDSAYATVVRQTGSLYRSVVRYISEKLCFIDPVDRTAFVQRSVDLVSKLNDQITMLVHVEQKNWSCCLKAATFNLVFANQTRQIASHDLVPRSEADRALNIVRETSKQLIALTVSERGLDAIRNFLEENKKHERREAGIRDDDYPPVEAYVVSSHILRNVDDFKGWFEDFTTAGLLSLCAGDLETLKDVKALERIWHGIFTTLPLNEMDNFGIAQVGSRFRRRYENWTIVKRLLLRVLDHYDAECPSRPAAFNNYCRALFHRCFHLINVWGWRDCKIILDTLFDFFAKHTLYNLHNEESFGSPSFLDQLDTSPSIEVELGDPCFHILLKIIGSGLRFLSGMYDKKKVRNFAWRLLPNHGRVYPKERPLRQEDLDALRNHHDLLCTLFWAVPDGCRPRLETIRNLVHPASSHRETCSISIRSWSRLVRFKLSTDEDQSGLDAFADWHGYFVTELVKQHSLARTEVEAQSNHEVRFSRQLIESTIAQNQRQIESLLSGALSGMKSAVGAARSLEQAQVLISKMPVTKLFALFNPKQSRINGVVSEALEVVMAYARKDDSSPASAVAAAMNDDSQEYGDWTGIEAICEDDQAQPNPGIQHVENVIHPAVSRLVSNCFGEDHCPEDAILLKVVDCWTCLAQTLVKHRVRHWDSYLSPYDEYSWTTLRETTQTRKFTPQFLASCIEKDPHFYAECKAQVLGMWVSSLVERTSMLKFQHRLTEALLNHDPESPLLSNLPFSRDRKSGRYAITLDEFGQRRLSLISSVLSNMREDLQRIEDTGASGLANTREEYRELIAKLMAAMKANYQELGNGSDSAQGAYVDFVHRIVGFLQQHAQGICPIDRFFTEPTSFPLPATDPTYIVARLKSYGLRLSAGKVAKQLVMFVQSVSERAAVDGQQVYLVDQLYTSMADTYENGNLNQPTLRSFLLQCVFPAYIESAFSNAAAWILARPILQATSRTFGDLLFNMDTFDTDCVSSVTSTFHTVFESAYRALHRLVDHPGMLEEPVVLISLAAFLEMITSALPVINHIDQNTDSGENLLKQLQVFRQFALFAVTNLFGPSMAVDSDTANGAWGVFSGRNTATTTVPRFFQEARSFASRELQTWLRTSWSRHEGKYFIRRGQQHKEVSVDPSLGTQSMEAAKGIFVGAVEVFFGSLQGLDIFGENDVEKTSCPRVERRVPVDYDVDDDSDVEIVL